MKALGKSPLPPCTLHAVGYLALALALCGWAAARSLEACGGEFTPPLDDTYIYLQYARSAAEGHPLSYQEGAEATRGATSLLYPLLLAPWAARLAPEALPWAAWAHGVLFLGLTALLLDRLARRLAGRRAGPAAGVLFLLNGHVVWGAAGGMDIALFSFALVAVGAAAARYAAAADAPSGLRRMALLAAALALLAFARPEGLLLAGAAAFLVPLAPNAPNSRRARWSLVLVPAAAAAVTAGITLLHLGHLGSNTLEAKAVWSEQRPDVRDAVLDRLPWVLGQITWALVSDFWSPAFGYGTGPALAGLLAVGAALGGVALLLPGPATRGGAVVLVLLGAGLLTGLIPVGFNSHHHRYQIPYVPLVMLLAVAGWWRVIPGRFARWRLAPVLLIALLQLPGLHRMVEIFGRNAGNIHDQQVAAGRWIDAELPTGAVVALNDAGALAYYGDRPILDLVGLVTNGSALPNRAGPASLFEWLQDLPPDRRPTHFAVFPDWFPYLKRTSLVGRKLAQFHLANNTISGAALKGIYEADWDCVPREDRPVVRAPLVEGWGFRIEDALDVADLDDERRHGYEAFDTWRQTLREFPVDGRPDVTLIDGGRRVSRGERFRLRCRPGEPAALVMRTEAFVDFELEVEINGRPAGIWRIERNPLVWSEPLLEIDGGLLDSGEAAITLVQRDAERPYPVFHYWLLQ